MIARGWKLIGLLLASWLIVYAVGQLGSLFV